VNHGHDISSLPGFDFNVIKGRAANYFPPLFPSRFPQLLLDRTLTEYEDFSVRPFFSIKIQTRDHLDMLSSIFPLL